MKLNDKIWIETNACWGWVATFRELNEKLELIRVDLPKNDDRGIAEKLRRNKNGSLDFGLYSEHTGQSLLEYFASVDQRDAFDVFCSIN